MRERGQDSTIAFETDKCFCGREQQISVGAGGMEWRWSAFGEGMGSSSQAVVLVNDWQVAVLEITGGRQ